MSIKVAGGYLRGRNLKTLKGKSTRPTTAKVREALFSILQHDLENARVLDLFAGSGALAIEAISRGVRDAVLVEKNHRAVGVIRENLAICDLDLRIINTSAEKAMEILSGEGHTFDLLFADPPYGLIDPAKLFARIMKYSLMTTGSLFIMEHAGDVAPEDEHIIQTRRFGDSAITIFAYDK